MTKRKTTKKGFRVDYASNPMSYESKDVLWIVTVVAIFIALYIYIL